MAEKYIPGQPQLDNRKVTTDELVEAGISHVLDSISDFTLRYKRQGLAATALSLAVLGIKLASLVMVQPAVNVGSINETPNTPTPRVSYAQQLLETPGLFGLKRSFKEQMELEGNPIYFAPVLGKQRKIASAGREGLFIRPVPFANEMRFPPVSALEWGRCFVWDTDEVVLLNKDGSADLFGVNPEGFIRLQHSMPNGDTAPFMDLDDPRCK